MRWGLRHLRRLWGLAQRCLWLECGCLCFFSGCFCLLNWCLWLMDRCLWLLDWCLLPLNRCTGLQNLCRMLDKSLNNRLNVLCDSGTLYFRNNPLPGLLLAGTPLSNRHLLQSMTHAVLKLIKGHLKRVGLPEPHLLLGRLPPTPLRTLQIKHRHFNSKPRLIRLRIM